MESVYHHCLLEELRQSGLNVASNVAVPIRYKGTELAEPLRLDILVEDSVIVELKAVETMHPVYKAQTISYLKLSGKPKALLINFCTENLTNSMISLVGESWSQLPEN